MVCAPVYALKCGTGGEARGNVRDYTWNPNGIGKTKVCVREATLLACAVRRSAFASKPRLLLPQKCIEESEVLRGNGVQGTTYWPDEKFLPEHIMPQAYMLLYFPTVEDRLFWFTLAMAILALFFRAPDIQRIGKKSYDSIRMS